MSALILLIAALLGFNHWLLEPAVEASSELLELAWLPWLLACLRSGSWYSYSSAYC